MARRPTRCNIGRRKERQWKVFLLCLVKKLDEDFEFRKNILLWKYHHPWLSCASAAELVVEADLPFDRLTSPNLTPPSPSSPPSPLSHPPFSPLHCISSSCLNPPSSAILDASVNSTAKVLFKLIPSNFKLREAAKKKNFFFGISFPNLFIHPPTPGSKNIQIEPWTGLWKLTRGSCLQLLALAPICNKDKVWYGRHPMLSVHLKVSRVRRHTPSFIHCVAEEGRMNCKQIVNRPCHPCPVLQPF